MFLKLIKYHIPENSPRKELLQWLKVWPASSNKGELRTMDSGSAVEHCKSTVLLVTEEVFLSSVSKHVKQNFNIYIIDK